MMRKLAKQTKQVAQNVQAGVRSAFRGVLNVVKSNADIQQVQVSGLADETLQDVEYMQHFGLTSVPPAGSQVVVIPLGGKTTHGIVIATENGSYRVKGLKNGEVALYDSSGSTIILKNNRVIEVECDTFSVKAKNIKFSGEISQTNGDFSTSGEVSAKGTKLSTHKHTEQGDGKPTSAPIL